MPKNTMTIGIRTEDVTKLICFNFGCKFNLYKDYGYYNCNLKYVEIDEDGKCSLREDRDNESFTSTIC